MAEIRTLRASWATARNGWSAARSDARQLLAHRRIMITTMAMVGGAQKRVLRTRIRLIGDTQTDVARAWIAQAAPQVVEQVTAAHFQSVAVAMSGFATALALQRLVTRLAMLGGTVAGAIPALRTLLTADRAQWLHLLLSQWWMLAGFGFALFALLVRLLLRRRLRALFRRGLG
jgi:hypothetical protein